MEFLLVGFTSITIKQLVMWAIGGLLIYLAIAKEFEPSLLLPMGFGAILVNIPMSGAVNQVLNGTHIEGILDFLFKGGISTEMFPLYLLIMDYWEKMKVMMLKEYLEISLTWT